MLKNIFVQLNPPILELLKLRVDLVNVDILPWDIIVAVDSVDDVVVQTIQLLEQDEFLLDLQQAWVLCHLQTKQLLTACVGGVLADERVKGVLEDDQSVGSIPRCNFWHHWSSLEENSCIH